MTMKKFTVLFPITTLSIASALLISGCATDINRANEDALNESAGLTLSATDRGVAVRLPEDVLFETGKSEIRMGAASAIMRSATLVNRSTKMISVEGHTDNVGTRQYNQNLSERRATAVREALVSDGVDPARITTKGYAYDRPQADNGTAEGRAQNRRTEIYIMDENLETILGKPAS